MFTSIASLDTVLQCPLASFHRAVVSDARRGVSRLGHVFGQANRVRRVRDDRVRYARFSKRSGTPSIGSTNFFSRSAWTVQELAHEGGCDDCCATQPTRAFSTWSWTTLCCTSVESRSMVWDGSAMRSPRRPSVWPRRAAIIGSWLGWQFRFPEPRRSIACRSTPGCICPGKNQPSEATLAKQMLDDILQWFPDRKLVFIGDGAYSANNLLAELDERVSYVGVMRSDAEIYTPTPSKAAEKQTWPQAPERTSPAQPTSDNEESRL